MSLSEQLSQNIGAYEKIAQELEERHLGQFALLSNGEFVQVYATRSDALKIGREKFGEGNFSIKQIGGRSLSRGIQTLNMNAALKR